MSKFSFVVPPLAGHVNPTLGLGAELLRRGHTVSWITPDDGLGRQLPPGGLLQLVRYESDDTEKGEHLAHLDSIYRKNVYGAESIKFLYEEVLIPLSQYLFAGICAHLDRFRPDVVISDHQLFAGAIAAVHKQLDYATSITAPAAISTMDELSGVHAWETAKILGLQNELGIQGKKSVACSDKMNIVFTSGALFGEHRLPDHYHFIGPAIRSKTTVADFDWKPIHSAGDQQKKLLVSIGTTFDHRYKKDFFATVREALKNEPIRVVVVSDPLLFDEWPPNFTVSSRIPQLELLPYLDAVVCHGGHNTVCEALTYGLPLVVIPIAYDQSHVAGRITATGSGIRLNFKRLKAADLRHAVQEVLNDARYRENAVRVGESFKKAGGAEKAAVLLERMAAGSATPAHQTI